MSNQIQITGGAKVRALDGVITGTTGVLSSVPLGGANGVATLDSSGKVPLAQLPASVFEYKGTWNATTNTPYLVNGVGTSGWVYVVSVGGLHDFGAGSILFLVGDQVLYDGSIWERSSGATGTVTSVALTAPSAFNVSGSPITTSGTLAITGAGTTSQYINGAGSLTTFPSLTGFVPYTGATNDLNLGTHNLFANNLFDGFINVAASGSQIVLTIASAPSYTITGSGGQTIKLPDATTLPNGAIFSFNNNQSSGAITINNNSNTLVVSVPSGGFAEVVLLDNSIAAGSWDRHFKAPSNVSWSTNTLDYAGSITSATWNGNVVAINRGGTGSSTQNFVDLTTTQTIGGAKTFSSSLTANSLIKTGGTSSQFLKADGSVDSSAYIILSSLSATSPIFYNITTGVISSQAASGSQNGYLTSSDWTTFNNKQSTLTFSSPLVNTSGTISIPAATSLVDGYLTSTNFSLFYNKQSQISLTTTGSSGSSTFIGTTLNIPTYSISGLGGVPTSRTLTINGVGYDLSADRSWTINSMVYPSAGIAVSTGTAWGISITDNSTNWNTAYTNRITSLTTTGTSGAATLISNVLNIPNYGSALSGYLPLTGGTLTGTLTISSGNLFLPNSISGRTSQIEFSNSDTIALLGMPNLTSTFYLKYGTDSIYFQNDSGGTILTLNKTATAVFTSSVTASSLIKSGGTSSQFLKADGSVDSSAYLTTSSAAASYLPLIGGTLSGTLYGISVNTTDSILTGKAFVSSGSLLNADIGANKTFIDNASGARFLSYGANSTTRGTITLFQASSTNTLQQAVLVIDANGNSLFYFNLTASSFIKAGGTSSQFLKADGSSDSSTYLTTSSASSTYIPYTGATTDVNLGSHALSAGNILGLTLNASQTSNTQSSLVVSNAGTFRIADFNNSGALVAYITNAGSIYGSSFVKSGGSSSQFLKADGSVDSNTYLTSGSFLPLTGGTLTGNLNITLTSTPQILLTHSNTSKTFLMAVDDSNAFFRANSTNNILFQVAGGTTALTIASTQTATFTGNIYMQSSANPTQLLVKGTNSEFWVDSNYGGGTARAFINRNTTSNQATLMFSTGIAITNGTPWAGACDFSMGTTNDSSGNFYIGSGDIYSSGNRAITISSANKIGINTSNPINLLQIVNTAGQDDAYGNVQVYYNGTQGAPNSGYTAKNYSGTSQFMQWTTYGLRLGSRIKTNSGEGGVYFTYGSDSVGMIITGSGNKIFCDNAGGTTYSFNVSAYSSGNALANKVSTTSGWDHFYFQNPNGNVGSISTSGSVTTYNVTSDYRLKDDFKEFNGLSIINKIKIYDFQWKVDKTRMYGVVAHELQEILPIAVTGEKDALNKDGEIKPQGVDYSKIVPILVKAIQELKAEIEELKNK